MMPSGDPEVVVGPAVSTSIITMNQVQRGLRLQQLYTTKAIFLMPNAWDAFGPPPKTND